MKCSTMFANKSFEPRTARKLGILFTAAVLLDAMIYLVNNMGDTQQFLALPKE